jgi:hypothetical protein
MKLSATKAFVVGLMFGGVVFFHLGMNYSRGRPLFSNPYAGHAVFLTVQEVTSATLGTTQAGNAAVTAPDNK